jgi:hypothetical protein
VAVGRLALALLSLNFQLIYKLGLYLPLASESPKFNKEFDVAVNKKR